MSSLHPQRFWYHWLGIDTLYNCPGDTNVQPEGSITDISQSYRIKRISKPSLTMHLLWSVDVCAQLCLTFCGPVDCSSPAFSVLGILQSRILERLPLFTVGNLPNPEIEFMSPMSPALAGGFFTTSASWKALWSILDTILCSGLNLWDKTVHEDLC